MDTLIDLENVVMKVLTEAFEHTLIAFNIAGISRCQDVASTVKSGDTLVLQNEPDNRFDPNAIKIVTLNGDKLGYVPATMCEKVKEIVQKTHNDKVNVKWVSQSGVGRYIGIQVTLSTAIQHTPLPERKLDDLSEEDRQKVIDAAEEYGYMLADVRTPDEELDRLRKKMYAMADRFNVSPEEVNRIADEQYDDIMSGVPVGLGGYVR